MKSVGLFKKLILCTIALMMLVQQHQAYSQALPVAPVANYVVNRAIGGVIAKVAISRGFAANDARIAATMAGVSSSMTAVNVVSTVGGVALAVAGAPVWLTVAGGLGILAVGALIVAGTTSLKTDGGVVTVVTGVPTSPPPYEPPGTTLLPKTDPDYNTIAQYLADGSKLYALPLNDDDPNMCHTGSPCMKLPVFSYTSTSALIRRNNLCRSQGSYVSCDAGGQGIVIPYFSIEEFAAHYFDGVVWNGPSRSGQFIRTTRKFNGLPLLTWKSGVNGSITGQVIVTNECKQGSPTGPNCDRFPNSITENFFSSNEAQNLSFFKQVASTKNYGTLDLAAAGIDAAQKAAKLSPEALASVVDKAWQLAASQPEYQGLPYGVTQPVTTAEVAAWQTENPALAPTLGDMLVPAVAPGVATIPISPTVMISPNPGTNPNPGNTDPAPVGIANVNVVNTPTVRVDFGSDPGVATPSLESTPTAQSILAPLLNLMPSLRSFVVPSHSSVCPKPSFSIFERQIVMSAHCAMLDDNKPTLYAVMAFVWLMLGTAIILKA
jgi:hypothetical protein